jgi:nucleoside-diphosphate-sugar epimerase
VEVLVLGGTRLVGPYLVRRLLEGGHTVTVATRGLTPDPFGDQVTRLRVDRGNGDALRQAVAGLTFDVVFDQICFNPREAEAAIEALDGRAGRYCLTSAAVVYDGQEGLLTEDDFDPWAYAIDLEASRYSLSEGKRQAEAYVVQNASMPVVVARLPFIVAGTADYTGRFAFQVRHVAEGRSLGVWPDDYEASFITPWDAGRFLAFLGTETNETGPVNGANRGYLSARALALAIGRHLKRTPRFHATFDGDPDRSPYAVAAPLCLSLDRARRWGFAFPALEPQLPQMVDEVLKAAGAPEP